jgi:EAL domain-containing protein (putative c-di-GMP-specific phosphodiesterase class I)
MVNPAESAPRSHLQLASTERELRQALRTDELRLHYQPIVRLDTCRVTGVEALLRWHHPGGALLAPDDFLPDISHGPLMRKVTAHALATACRDAARWPEWTVAVNVAASDVVNPQFVSVVTTALAESGLAPERLTLELTEHAVLQDVAHATAQLRKLRDLGIRLALDDFGTGYSSLLYLRELPITQIKIDKAFTTGVDRNTDDVAIVESLVRLAHRIDLAVVAEGVETPAQARFLRSLGCQYAQGYLFARPATADAVTSRVMWIDTSKQTRRKPTRRQLNGTAPATVVAQIQELVGAGASLHTIAAALNRGGVTTERGTRWTAATVAPIVATLPEQR